MIILTRLNGVTFALNCDLIETITENPDTTIHLINGNFHIVKESMVEIINQSIAYRRQIFAEYKNPEQC
jgi:flagellar protein FlbD